MQKLRFLLWVLEHRWRKTKETKDRNQNNSKQDLTTKGRKQCKYNAPRYLQKDPKLRARIKLFYSLIDGCVGVLRDQLRLYTRQWLKTTQLRKHVCHVAIRSLPSRLIRCIPLSDCSIFAMSCPRLSSGAKHSIISASESAMFTELCCY